jgi:hypothetical protein
LPRSISSWNSPMKRIFKRHSCSTHALSSSSSFSHSQGTQSDSSCTTFLATYPYLGQTPSQCGAWLHCTSLTLYFSNANHSRAGAQKGK